MVSRAVSPSQDLSSILRSSRRHLALAGLAAARLPCASLVYSPSTPRTSQTDSARWTRILSAESTNSRKRLQWVAAVRIPLLARSSYLPESSPVSSHCSSTGTVFQGVHTIAGKEVAIKLEPALARPSVSSPLKQESKIYKTLMGGPGVPWIMWSGKHGDYNVMVIDLLGDSLEDLFRMCNRYFSLKTVLLLADQLVSAFSSFPPFRRVAARWGSVASCQDVRSRRLHLDYNSTKPMNLTASSILICLDLTDRIYPQT